MDFLRRHNFTDYALISHAKNVGTVQNLLDAAKNTRNNYVKCIGQGDMLSDEFVLRDLYNDFITTDAEVMGADYVSFKNFAVPLELIEDYRIPQDMNCYRNGSLKEKRYNLLIKHDYIHGPTLIYKRESLIYYLELLAAAKIKYTEDIIPWIMVADKVKISYLNRITVYYELGIGFSSSRSSVMRHNHEDTIRLIIKRIQDKDPDFARELADEQKKRIDMRKQYSRKKAHNNKIKKRLGIFARPVIMAVHFIRYIRSLIIKPEEKPYIFSTRTDVNTDFANLCITRE